MNLVRASTKLIGLIGEDHDAPVKHWRDQLTEDLKLQVKALCVISQ